MSLSDDQSPHLGLPFMAPAQARKHITHNEALSVLDDIVQLSIIQRDLNAPPPAPENGARYIVASAATGAWASQEATIASWRNGGWQFLTPQTGWRAFDQSGGALCIFNGSEWTVITASSDQSDVLGVNTDADTTNRLAVKSDAVLHSHDDITPGSGDVRHVLNKVAPENTGSFLFQSAFAGHAEMGLLGSNDFAFKVSADGENWITAMVIDRASGEVSFPASPTMNAPSLPAGYDYYVDPQTGNDAADGSRETPFATLGPLRALMNAHTATAVTLRAYIESAIYSDDHFNLSTLAAPAEITFGDDAQLLWTLGTDQSGIQSGNDGAGALTVFGNGLIIDGFDTGTGNGLGANNNQLIAHDIIVRNCSDGVSGHGTAHIETYNCRFEDCTKYAVAHVNSATSRHVDCYFRSHASAVGIGTFNNDLSHVIENCEFDSPAGLTQGIVGGSGTTLTGCRVGSLTQSVKIQGTLSITDSFVSASGEGNATLTLTRAFGWLNYRHRSGGALIMTNCVLDGSLMTGGHDLLYTNFDAGSFAPVTIEDCAITGYGTAIQVSNANYLSYWQNAGSAVSDNIMFGNTANIGPHLQGEIGVSITGTDAATPTIGARGTTVMSDWALTGAQAGFDASEAVVVGVRT